MRKIALLLMLLAALGCMKKSADGTYRVDKKSMQSAAKRVEKKAGEGLTKAGEKLKRDAAKH